MANPKGKNQMDKLKALADNGKSEALTVQPMQTSVLPAELHNGHLPAPQKIETVGEIRAELARIYKLVFKGKIMLADATRLAYFLDKMIAAIKIQTELDVAAAAYSKAWEGVTIVTDENEKGGKK